MLEHEQQADRREDYTAKPICVLLHMMQAQKANVQWGCNMGRPLLHGLLQHHLSGVNPSCSPPSHRHTPLPTCPSA